MSRIIFRSINELIRKELSWETRWRGEDNGLISSWESGRELREKEPELAIKAENGELPVLGWKGGVEKEIQKKEKYGTFNYVAKWQGLRGEDLNIDTSIEMEMICTRTGMKFIYTSDIGKYKNA